MLALQLPVGAGLALPVFATCLKKAQQAAPLQWRLSALPQLPAHAMGLFFMATQTKVGTVELFHSRFEQLLVRLLD